MHFVQCALPPTEGLLQSKHQAGTWSPSSLLVAYCRQATRFLNQPSKAKIWLLTHPNSIPENCPSAKSVLPLEQMSKSWWKVMSPVSLLNRLTSSLGYIFALFSLFQVARHFCLVKLLLKVGSCWAMSIITHIIIVYFPSLESSHFYFILQATLTLL